VEHRTGPFEPKPGLYIRETIQVIDNLDLTADQKDQIPPKRGEGLEIT
jgi:hypothetical protein